MASTMTQRASHWHKTPSNNRTSLDKSLPSRPMEHSNGRLKKPDATTSSTAPTTKAPASDPAMTTVLIGPNKQRFKVNKKLLCASSPFFRERLEDPSQTRPISLWLPSELPSVFGLFVEWLHARHSFRRHLDHAVMAAQDQGGCQQLQDMHWTFIRLHLFASHLCLYHLQDSAMDALQDLYLKCDWDVTPSLLSYLYTKCEALPAVRLRRWAVAMVAFSLTGSPSSTTSSPVKLHPSDPDVVHPSLFYDLIDSLPELRDDYAVHMHKMESSGLDVRFKNPQLRIPANKLRNEERAFGFRECSFHSHRATVGERRCPHERKRLRHAAAAAAKGGGVVAGLETPVDDQLTGLMPPSRRPSCREKDAVPRPLFSRDGQRSEEEERLQALKHVRSVSSTLK